MKKASIFVRRENGNVYLDVLKKTKSKNLKSEIYKNIGEVGIDENKHVFKNTVKDRSILKELVKEVEGVFLFFSQLQTAIDEDRLMITENKFEFKDDNLIYLFTALPMEAFVFTSYKYASTFHPKDIAFATENFIFEFKKGDLLLDLFSKRVLNHLSVHSKYRPQFLFDERFDHVRRFQHTLKKGDLVQFKYGEKEGVIESFYITDDFVEHAAILVNGKPFSCEISSLELVQ